MSCVKPGHMHTYTKGSGLPPTCRTCAEQKLMSGGGLKFDLDKPPVELISSPWVLGVSQVLGKGAAKYGRSNWRGGIIYSRLISATFRHLLAFNAGEDMDPEFELSHLLHASACLMFLYEQTLYRKQQDDRYKLNEETNGNDKRR